MKSRREALRTALGALAAALGGSLIAMPGRAQDPPAPAIPPPPLPGRAAPAAVVEDLRAALGLGIRRFETKDLVGVLALVSDQYWTGLLTKPTVRAQLLAMFQVYQQLRARVRLDEVRLVGEHAWVYSTGDILGQLPVVGQWTQILAWERELEVARREQGAWRLYGYQQ